MMETTTRGWFDCISKQKSRVSVLAFSVFLACGFLLLGAGMARAETEINETTFPDANFRAVVLANYSDGSGNVDTSVTEILVHNKEIQDMTGIEHFPALTLLGCSNNQITFLDISKNTALKIIACEYNQLASLNVSSISALQQLYCDHNQLSSLNISSNTALTHLYCYTNPLSSLDVSKNIALRELYCSTNQLTSLDVSKNAALIDLSCGDNSLSSLDLSKNTTLAVLYCDRNLFTTLDVSNNTALRELYCSGLTSLDITKNTALGYLVISDSSIASLNLTNNASLYALFCSNDLLISLDISKNTGLTQLYCPNNQLTSLNTSSNTALTRIVCNDNQIASLDLSHNTELHELYCENNRLTSLDISHNPALIGLLCYGNRLTSLTVSNNPKLNDINCSGNQLTSLNVSGSTVLQSLNCHNNQLASLDVSSNAQLLELFCYSNTLPALDLSHNTHLVMKYADIAGQHVGSLLYEYKEGVYQTNLAGLPYGNSMDMTRVTMTDGGTLDSSTGIVTYTSPPAAIMYDYDTKNPYGPKTSMGVTADAVAATYTVSYASGGGTGAMASDTATTGIPMPLPACGFTAPAYQEFSAWKIGENTFQPGDDVLFTKNTTVTALWKNITYALTYAPGAGSGAMDPSTVTASVPFTLPACSFTAPEYQEFTAWKIGEDAYQPGESVVFTANATVTAQWKAIAYAVTYTPGGGSGTMDPGTATAGTPFPLPACGFTAPADQLFSAWKIGENTYQPDDAVLLTENTTVTAVWRDVESGDANCDGSIDIMDLVNIIDCIVSGTAPASMAGADANGDGSVDIMDLVYIVNLIVG